MRGNIFIKRPVTAIFISVLILVVGPISLLPLPVEQYSNIALPTVNVSVAYTDTGVNAMMNSITMPLEESINGVESMVYITSTVTNVGTVTIKVFFKQGTDPDMVVVNVQNRVPKTQDLLSVGITKIGISTQKRRMSFLQTDALVCDNGHCDQTLLINYLGINIIPQVKHIEGVGDAMMLGDAYSTRIWLKPDCVAQYGLMPSGVTAILGGQNLEAPTSQLGEDSQNVFQCTMKYRERLKNVNELKEIVIRSRNDGSALQLKNTADVELGTSIYGFDNKMDSKTAVTLLIFQTAGSNATAVNEQITNLSNELEQGLPKETSFITMMGSNDLLFASIYNVVGALIVAIILVVLVVYFFLQDFKGTLIPSISIIVSLVGTSACLVTVGFSISILVLFTLMSAIGTVVSNTIVVVGAVQTKFDVGYELLYQATKDAMGNVIAAVISCTCVFMAVLVLVTFMGGTSGIFYTQLDVTIVTSVGISMISALTLCPVFCVIMIRPSDDNKSTKGINGRICAAYNALFNTMLEKYKKGVIPFAHHRWMVWILLIVMLVLSARMMMTTKTSLALQEGQGATMVSMSIAPDNTLEEDKLIMVKIEKILESTPKIEHYTRIVGYGLISGQGAPYGSVITRLKDWDKYKGKEHTTDAVIARFNAQFHQVKEAQILSFQTSMIPGYGMSNSIELNMQDKTGGDKTVFYDSVLQLPGALNQRPEIAMVYSPYIMNLPQISIGVDAARCKRAGISPTSVLDIPGSYCSGAYIFNCNQFGKVYRMTLQTFPEYRLDEQALDSMFVRSRTEMAPTSQLVTPKRIMESEVENRFNLFSAITVGVNLAPGYPTGGVQQVIKEVVNQNLPAGCGYEYGSMSCGKATSGDTQTILIYAICTLLIFLILACLYGSFLVPFTVIFPIPFGPMGSFLFAKLLGLEDDIYLQTGVIMLVGLLAETATLITEYAIERRRKDMGIIGSAYSAAQVRLRPILVTVLAMTFGMLPLVSANGVGISGSSSLGTGIVGGMAIGTLALLLAIPVFYIAFGLLQEKICKPMEVEADLQVLQE